MDEPLVASKTQNQWKLHNNSLTKRGGGLIEDGAAIEECVYEEDLLSNSNKENKKKSNKKKPIQNQTVTNGFGIDYNKNRDSLRSR